MKGTTMQAVIQKWGNSLGIRIPNLYVKELCLKHGLSVDIVEKDGAIVIVPPKMNLESLLAQITSENAHASVETGTSLGNEEW